MDGGTTDDSKKKDEVEVVMSAKDKRKAEAAAKKVCERRETNEEIDVSGIILRAGSGPVPHHFLLYIRKDTRVPVRCSDSIWKSLR